MTHEMTREDARLAGYEVDDLPAVVEGEEPDQDVVNVWAQLPDADSIEAGPDAEAGDALPLEAPSDAEVAELTTEVNWQVDNGRLPAPDVQLQEVSDA